MLFFLCAELISKIKVFFPLFKREIPPTTICILFCPYSDACLHDLKLFNLKRERKIFRPPLPSFLRIVVELLTYTCTYEISNSINSERGEERKNKNFNIEHL